MSAISSAASQFFTPVTAPKPDAASLNQSAKNPAAGDATATTQSAPAAKVELSSTRNSDGTYGPNHLRTKPGALPVVQSQSSDAVSSVDVKV